MTTIVTRAGKGSPLTNNEMDTNLTNLNTYKLETDSNLSDLTNTTTARTNLGLGSMATQNANNVTITGGSVSGITDLAVADGGTGASNASGARTNLGLVIGTDVQAYNSNLTTWAGTTAPSGTVVGTSDSQTLTNKRITQRVNNNGATTSGTITPTGDSSDQYELLGLTGTVTVAAPSGTPTAGQKLTLRFKDNGTARTINWTTTSGGYRIIGTTLPTTTVASKNTYIGCIYNATDSYWDVVAVTTEA